MRKTPLFTALVSMFCANVYAQTGIYVGTERSDLVQGITKELPAKGNKEVITITPLNDSTLNLTYIRDYTVRGRKQNSTEIVPVRLHPGGRFVEIAPKPDLYRAGSIEPYGMKITAYDKRKEPMYTTILKKQ